MIAISPSILSCDYSIMGNEVERMEDAGATWIHYDVMDGHFVPNITIGAPVLKSLRKNIKGVADVHLMISDPLKYVEDFAKAGADVITFHVESDSNPMDTIQKIRSLGCKVGISVKPKTPASEIFPYLDKVDLVLVMTVEPGFGGQSFMADMMPKVRLLREYINTHGLDCELEVDGGVNPETAAVCINAGANVLVAGSDVFKASDRAARIKQLRN